MQTRRLIALVDDDASIRETKPFACEVLLGCVDSALRLCGESP